MNEKKVDKVQMTRGKDVEIIMINPEAPFTIIVPTDVDEIILYNALGQNISMDNISVY